MTNRRSRHDTRGALRALASAIRKLQGQVHELRLAVEAQKPVERQQPPPGYEYFITDSIDVPR